jgi:hypothetical protein
MEAITVLGIDVVAHYPAKFAIWSFPQVGRAKIGCIGTSEDIIAISPRGRRQRQRNSNKNELITPAHAGFSNSESTIDPASEYLGFEAIHALELDQSR